MRDELQELVDRVAGLLGAPATLEDADFTLLAFCAHPVDGADTPVMDAVRTRSILGRGSTPATRLWFEDFGIAVAEGPLRTPGDPDAGILTRLVLPVRHSGRTHGYLWLLDGGRTDPAAADDPALAGAVKLAAEAGRLLAEREESAGDLARPLATALTGSPAARAQAVRTLAAAWGERTPVVLVALRPAGAGLPSPWRAPAAGAVSAVLPGEQLVAVAVPLPGRADLRPAAAVTAAALAGLPPGSTAGLSAVGTGAEEPAGRWDQARTAARVAAAVPRFSPVAHWDELGGWRLAAALPGPDPVVRPLLADPVLTATAETWLDAGCSAARASAALHVHRQTLYYRLARIAELTGLDVADGDARLLLHASLRRARLP
ncbi:helix-turn-helix domain-containing protein [Geodermatophilus obscurus]|uniref:Putative transcriptional regulator, PucR family n=1 Tax=Geodermatophilus obscurus (strain ATCC 25078 / DSM 43160 / JCM 3152 / CCUG 61914 / KCC A-0152 / KCTC 9177 / NBRC 13315 / NRRL B-3577 / G-20) TaxID=526225 RepID=D2SBY7_GEOOG|nr:helix-turn-helix domain-containing protein [Geodermatophilus obscurus]ADB74155.1 putative transcriptional regulator, PucR family [Geodermatophilus obscurus DSM 43160]